MTQRLYTEMNADEQLQWVTEFGEIMEQHGERLALLTKGKATATTDDAAAIRRIFSLLSAWPFAQDFCEKAQRYGDYMARTSRLPIYIEKVKEKLADGLTMTDAQGRIVAYVNPSTPLRRRGRPTKEEVAARLRGETITMQGGDNPEARKRRTIAKMLGLQVVVHGDAPREKNNAEIAAEKAAKQAEYDRQNPSLFSQDKPTVPATAIEIATSSPSGNVQPEVAQPSEGSAVAAQIQPANGGSLACPTMSEVYQSRIDQDRLRLSDLAWLCSDELRQRIPTVQGLRVTAESSSERAKTMADMGAKPEDIEPYAQQAKEAVEGYLAIYAAVDEELAIQFKRLSLDHPYIDRFKARFKGVDLEKVLHICRPYYEKVKEQEKKTTEEARAKAKAKGENEEQAVAAYLADHQPIDQRVKNLVERDNPEYAAKLAKEQAEKEELQALHRYIMRKDKDPSDERCRTLEKRIARIRELAGDAVADSYLPVLEKTRADNIAWRAAKGRPAPGKPADTVGTVPAVDSDAQERTTEGLSPSVSVAPKERKKPSAKSADKKPSPKKPAKK